MKYAEELPYWQTSQTSPDTWIDRTIKILTELGGTLQMEAFGKDGQERGAFMVSFSIQNENYRIVWPVINPKPKPISRKPSTGKRKTLLEIANEDNKSYKAAKIQAATSLYHYVKAISLAAAVIGTKAALFTFMQLPDGSTVIENADNAILQAGSLFRLPSSTGQDDIYDGEVKIV